MRLRVASVLSILIAVSCAGSDAVHPASRLQHATAMPSPDATTSAGASANAKTSGEPKPTEPKRDVLLEWVRSKLPSGGAADRDNDGALVVTHQAGPKDTIHSVAKIYLDLTSVYLSSDLAKHIAKKNGAVIANKTVTIPDILSAPYKNPTEERMAWPADKSLRAIYLGGRDALGKWEDTLEHLRVRDMNAVVLDGKAYMGELTYPSKVDVAIRTNAVAGAPIADLSRTIRFAHEHGVRVIMRVSCFHDPLAAEKAPDLSVKGNWGGPYPIGWLDPGSDKAQKYVFDLMEEEIALGADEINLDYVRYPVQGGLGNADFHLKDTGRTRVGVIRDFVHKAHAITQAHHVPLSIDIFGVTATGNRQDIEALGQDIALLGPEVEVLMPMVYPSHYGTGYYGWDTPGNHPEIVAIGTKATLGQLQKVGSTALVRPWLQAFMWRSPDYGPQYLHQETLEAQKGGGVGYSMWNPGGSYVDAWNAIKPVAHPTTPSTSALVGASASTQP
jgi:hypothetical protein